MCCPPSEIVPEGGRGKLFNGDGDGDGGGGGGYSKLKTFFSCFELNPDLYGA